MSAPNPALCSPLKIRIEDSYDPSDQPLDLSLNRAEVSVIRATGLLQRALSRPLATQAPTPLALCPQGPSPSLPQCKPPNLNSNWMAIKFGAAVGPNRMSYPREFKLMVIDYYTANGHNKYRTCKHFQITKSMLNGWLAKIEKIRESRPGSLKSGRSGRRPQFPDIEKQLYELYKQSMTTGQKIGNRWIRDTARSLAQQQCSIEQLSGMCQFSERWLSNFKKRYRINLNRDWVDSASTSSVSNGSAIAAEPSLSESSSCPTEVSDSEHSIPDTNNTPLDFTKFMSPTSTPTSTTTIPTPQQSRRGRKVQFPQVERILYSRLTQRRCSGLPVSNRWVQAQARAIASQLCPQILSEAARNQTCLFSDHWLHNFKRRYKITLKSPEETATVVTHPIESRPINISHSLIPPMNVTHPTIQPINNQMPISRDVTNPMWLLQQALAGSAFRPLVHNSLYRSLLTQTPNSKPLVDAL